MKRNNLFFLLSAIATHITGGGIMAQLSDEAYRPKIHFTPKAHWMNDPNGMVYYKGIYHLFFQYHPGSSVWGPMHWGHATSKDLVQWNKQPIAIYPDSIGTIFSGSAVVDRGNTSGFGKKGQAPLVSMYTQHNMEGEKAGRSDFQTQSIAYSNDNGKTWIKHAGNPVIKNPGIRDFRDPKVIWFESQKKWVVSIATKDNIAFYSSKDLKHWTKESTFGDGRGAHGGGWECPDLFPLDDKGTQRWVLLVNLNPGAPNGGSGTQYFIGNFNGKNFTSNQTGTKWMDYGPDNYAGVTWSNTGKRITLIGWMSNWQYATLVPTETWRSAMTVPRDLTFRHVGNDIFLASEPVPELNSYNKKSSSIQNITVSKNKDLTKLTGPLKFPGRLNLALKMSKDFSLIFSNGLGEELAIGYMARQKQYFIDRSKSGKTDFQKDFAGRHTAPRLAIGDKMNLNLILDAASVELFADDGLTLMTEIFFPTTPYDSVRLEVAGSTVFEKIEWIGINK